MSKPAEIPRQQKFWNRLIFSWQTAGTPYTLSGTPLEVGKVLNVLILKGKLFAPKVCLVLFLGGVSGI